MASARRILPTWLGPRSGQALVGRLASCVRLEMACFARLAACTAFLGKDEVFVWSAWHSDVGLVS
jgi:hypothetical protein